LRSHPHLCRNEKSPGVVSVAGGSKFLEVGKALARGHSSRLASPDLVNKTLTRGSDRRHAPTYRQDVSLICREDFLTARALSSASDARSRNGSRRVCRLRSVCTGRQISPRRADHQLDDAPTRSWMVGRPTSCCGILVTNTDNHHPGDNGWLKEPPDCHMLLHAAGPRFQILWLRIVCSGTGPRSSPKGPIGAFLFGTVPFPEASGPF
jgi:hypothetical protein